MDIGEQKRVIQIEPEPLRRPEFLPDRAVPERRPGPEELEPAAVPEGPTEGEASRR